MKIYEVRYMENCQHLQKDTMKRYGILKARKDVQIETEQH